MSADPVRLALKLATENKITSQNTWQLAFEDIIEAIHNPDTYTNEEDQQVETVQDGDINFRTVAHLLNTCSLIYDRRVENHYDRSLQFNKTISGEVETESEEKIKKTVKNTTLDTEANLIKKNIQTMTEIDPLYDSVVASIDQGEKSSLMDALELDFGLRIIFDQYDVIPAFVPLESNKKEAKARLQNICEFTDLTDILRHLDDKSGSTPLLNKRVFPGLKELRHVREEAKKVKTSIFEDFDEVAVYESYKMKMRNNIDQNILEHSDHLATITSIFMDDSFSTQNFNTSLGLGSISLPNNMYDDSSDEDEGEGEGGYFSEPVESLESVDDLHHDLHSDIPDLLFDEDTRRTEDNMQMDDIGVETGEFDTLGMDYGDNEKNSEFVDNTNFPVITSSKRKHRDPIVPLMKNYSVNLFNLEEMDKYINLESNYNMNISDFTNTRSQDKKTVAKKRKNASDRPKFDFRIVPKVPRGRKTITLTDVQRKKMQDESHTLRVDTSSLTDHTFNMHLNRYFYRPHQQFEINLPPVSALHKCLPPGNEVVTSLTLHLNDLANNVSYENFDTYDDNDNNDFSFHFNHLDDDIQPNYYNQDKNSDTIPIMNQDELISSTNFAINSDFENLISPEVNKIALNYAKIPKQFNIRAMKKAIHNSILDKSNSTIKLLNISKQKSVPHTHKQASEFENETPESNSNTPSNKRQVILGGNEGEQKCVSFKKLVDDLNTVSQKANANKTQTMKENAHVSSYFIGLLLLANEQKLELRPNTVDSDYCTGVNTSEGDKGFDLSDFVIFAPSDSI